VFFLKTVSTLFLKFAVVFIGIPIFLLCIFLVPEIAKFAGEFSGNAFFKYLIFVVFYGATIPFYFALFLAFKLLLYIDNNEAFSEISVNALKKIKQCAITISTLHLFALPVFYLFAEADDAPGVIFIGLLVPFASMVIAVFAAVLQKLLTEAIDIKSENDLTV
jgi:hypothetical protein